MSSLTRQNTLFVSEDWIQIYEAIQNVEFRAYDFDNFVSAIFNNLRETFPEEFNDWIDSSEFVMKVEVLAWLSQNISFRIDLNTRENFLATAERRDSLIRLAQNIAYRVNRVRGARGEFRIESIRTDQSLFDSNNVALQDREIVWNDPRNEDFFEQFIVILNSAFTNRTQFGRPLIRFQDGVSRIDQYVINGQAPSDGVYSFASSVNGVSLPFDIINARVNKNTGQFEELAPNPENAFNMFFRQDGLGLASNGSGFFVQTRQGRLQFREEEFLEPIRIRTVDIGVENINNDDFFIQEIDAQGNIIDEWEQVDTVFGESVSFLPTDSDATRRTSSSTIGNQATGNARKVYELDTLDNDRVRVRFGDGSFGAIPTGRFRFGYRTSNREPQVVEPSDIGQQTFTQPYTSNGQVFFLSITVALKEPIVNAARSETNFSIRTRANQVFYTQNRMITGRDYQAMYLRDNAIAKVKTVNRTYAGHSRFSALNDPTGLYQNLKITAEDGRIYNEDTLNVQFVTADTDILTNEQIVNQFIQPLLRKADKELKYYNDYPEAFFTNVLLWDQTSVVSDQSRGNITFNGVVQKVGDAATLNNLDKVNTDSVLRIKNAQGPTVRVVRVTDDGDIPDGIIFDQVIDDGTRLISVFPPFRNKLINAEQFSAEEQLNLNLNFGLSWNQNTETWDIITFDNLDADGEFSLEFQGDTSGAQLDASWLVKVEFIPGGADENQWRISDRGFGIFFESARENDFFFANNESVLDPETGQIKNDAICILECNEAKDSLRRRGIQGLGDLACPLFVTEDIGDGTTTQFKTSFNPLDPNSVITVDGVLQILGQDYSIITNVTGDIIQFVTAPVDGASILISLSEQFVNGVVDVRQFDGDGSTFEFDLTVELVIPTNLFVFVDGVMQRSSVDYGVGNIGTNASLVFTGGPPGPGTSIFVYMIHGIDSLVWTKLNFVGTGAQTDYILPVGNQNINTILMALDGIVQDSTLYTVVSTATSTTVSFTTAPGAGQQVRIVATRNPEFTKTRIYNFPTNGIQNSFALTGLNFVFDDTVIVAFNGVAQEGPWGAGVWSMSSNNVVFTTPPLSGTTLTVFVVAGAVGITSLFDEGFGIPDATTDNNLGNIAVSSCTVNYLGVTIPLFVEDALRHSDGYVNPNGLQVVPGDSDNSGFFDNPFIFKDLVVQDGITDLVLWRKIEESGVEITDPISPLTNPRGTYGRSSQGDIAAGDVLGLNDTDGDVHYDTSTNTWLVANATTGLWVVAPDQDDFIVKIGRDNLKFLWKHFAPDAFRIDPSVSNIMDTYILTTTFDEATRVALDNNTPLVDLPTPPTPESLRIQFADFDDFKAMSDSIVYHPARYKILFGDQAIPLLQAFFKVVQTQGSLISDSQLKLDILNAINQFFAVDNMDFGETFYLTELLAFIHQQLAPDVQSVVAVPKTGNQTFGRLFQIRSEPDELFISAASATDIELVDSLTDEELRIGTFVV
jgi:hypothetical protein